MDRLKYEWLGEAIYPPTLDDIFGGIVASRYMYDTDGTIVPTRTVFGSPSPRQPFGERMGASVSLYWASVENIAKLATLPTTPADQKRVANELVSRWGMIIPTISATSIDAKIRSEVVPSVDRRLTSDTRHRVPVSKRVETVTRAPNMFEAMAGKVSVTEERVVEEPDDWTAPYYRLAIPYPPYSQQVISAHAIVMARRYALWHDMRVGKTYSVILAFLRLRELGVVDKLIVVCPVDNMDKPWLDELPDSNLSCCALDGSREKDAAALEDDEYDVYVVNYERLRLRMESIQGLSRERTMVAFDETSAAKNPMSRRSQACWEVGRYFDTVVLLNGTPQEQGPQDYYSQMRIIDRYGVIAGPNYSHFIKRWLYEPSQGKFRVYPARTLEFIQWIAAYSFRYLRIEADQSNGKDKQYRYIHLPPTKDIYNHTRQILQGCLEIITDEGLKQESMTRCLLRTYGFLREAACSYGKWRYSENDPYTRFRDKYDPKILWVLAYLRAHPEEPLIVYTEFNEQEQRLKEALNEVGVKWSSTKPEMKRTERDVLSATIPQEMLMYLREHPDRDLREVLELLGHGFEVVLPMEIREDPRMVEWVRKDKAGASPDMERIGLKMMKVKALRDGATTDGEYQAACVQLDKLRAKFKAIEQDAGHARWLDHIELDISYKDLGPYKGSERSAQYDAFNEGETRVMIMKTSQARGMNLSRKKAVAMGKGTYPSMVYMAPSWSLGQWMQSQDRANTVDPDTGKNVCTKLFALFIKGSFEEKMLKALRLKKKVQEEMLRDNLVEGFESFKDAMMESLEDAMNDNGMFDCELMIHRAVLGIPPESKMTESLIRNKAARRIRLDTDKGIKPKDIHEWMSNRDTDCKYRIAYFRLMKAVNQ